MAVNSPSTFSTGINRTPIQIPPIGSFQSTTPIAPTSASFRPGPIPQFRSPYDALVSESVQSIPGLQAFGVPQGQVPSGYKSYTPLPVDTGSTLSNIQALSPSNVRVGAPIPMIAPASRFEESGLIVDMPNISGAPTTTAQINALENQASALESDGINWLGKDGVLIPGLNAFSNLSNAILGYQQLGLAKEAFDFNKRLTETNLANQARTTNADIIARERSQLRQRGGNQIPNLDQLARTRSQDRLVKGTL